MRGDYFPINKHTHSNKYAMPLLEKIFDALGQAKVFSTLDLRCGYHQLSLKEGDKVKRTFWESIFMGKIVCTNGGFYISRAPPPASPPFITFPIYNYNGKIIHP